MNSATIINLDWDTMSEYFEMWCEACNEQIEALNLDLSEVEAFTWDDEDASLPENWHFALPIAKDRYWTAFGFCNRVEQQLLLCKGQ